MKDYQAYCKHHRLDPNHLTSARTWRKACLRYQKANKERLAFENELREKYRKDTCIDAVEKNTLLAIINDNHQEFERLIKILKGRKQRGGLKVINPPAPK